jgi:hypothetical protein
MITARRQRSYVVGEARDKELEEVIVIGGGGLW